MAGLLPNVIEQVVAAIAEFRPDLVFAPHVETSSGILLPDDYLRRIADAVHAIGGLLVLDCIASGALWVDMRTSGVDVLLSAPQKGWSAPACCGLIMLSEVARQRIEGTQSTSFACDLRRWLGIMEAYEAGGHAYYTTMPTGALAVLRDAMLEVEQYGFGRVRDEQCQLGADARAVAVARFQERGGAGFCFTQRDRRLHHR